MELIYETPYAALADIPISMPSYSEHPTCRAPTSAL
jgi:hypothetical protein